MQNNVRFWGEGMRMADLETNIATITLSDLKRDPKAAITAYGDRPVAVLENGRVMFYCLSAAGYEALQDCLEDLELGAIADARANAPVVRVSLDEL